MTGTKCNLEVIVIAHLNLLVLLYNINLLKNFHEIFGLIRDLKAQNGR